jgi:DNA-binding response OmpR family regulator
MDRFSAEDIDFDCVPEMYRTVLIAFEDEAFRKYLATPLAAKGFRIWEATDGNEAWQVTLQEHPGLILADISMPEVDGIEFCRRLRNAPLLSHTPLLFIAGPDKYEERHRALQVGADDFLSKEMPILELLMRIQLLLSKYDELIKLEAAEAKRRRLAFITAFGAGFVAGMGFGALVVLLV